MQAASVGIHEAIAATPEQRQELQSIMSQIEKRIALGTPACGPCGTISVRKLKDELYRLGVNEIMAGRAIMTMEKAESVILRNERRSIKRV
eukprot:scaffold676833_cov60-Prasinocladus_malaysianus.AAC.1